MSSPSYFLFFRYRRGSLSQPDIDLSKYVAAAVVSFRLDPSPSASSPLPPTSLSPEWIVHLDLTTDHTARRAYAYSSPVVADVDGDGIDDVVVATGLGFVYVLDPKTGATKKGWPAEIGEVQGTPVVADLDGDHKKEVIVTDALGNVVAFDGQSGKEKWHSRVQGTSYIHAAQLSLRLFLGVYVISTLYSPSSFIRVLSLVTKSIVCFAFFLFCS